MPIISYMGEDFDSPNIQVQDNGSATYLDDTKVPTGRTVESYINSKIQDNASATDLENYMLPTGRTIENYAQNKCAPFVSTTSFDNIVAAAKSAPNGFVTFRVSGSTGMPNSNNTWCGFMWTNPAATWGFCMCMTFNTYIYVRVINGSSSWSSWTQK